MNKATLDTTILSISLDRQAGIPLQTQLLQALRERVHLGQARPGERLPSSRNLAEELGVSRVTTTAVYDQLIAEGYLEGRRGSGVYVASDLPDIPVRLPFPNIEPSDTPPPSTTPVVPFGTGHPDLSSFPFREWTRLHDRIWRAPGDTLLGRVDPMGFGPLRLAIAKHLREWRGLQCSADQIVITSGLVEAVELFANAQLTPGERILIEEPGHKVLANALTGCGMVCDPVRIDEQGFNLANVRPDLPPTKVVSVTPSRQYPLGVTLPLARRLELLSWAKEQDGFILEDDYDGEFRYQGQPLPAMMSLDTDERVLYIGSFSKVMFPALRLGYMVVPPRLLPAVRSVLAAVGSKAALMAQPVLAEFITQGSLATHIRRMRRLYGERQRALCKALVKHADGLITANPEPGGMHLVASLHPDLDGHLTDTDISNLAQEINLRVAPLSAYFYGPPDQQALLLGYAAFEADDLDRAVAQLSQATRHALDRGHHPTV